MSSPASSLPERWIQSLWTELRANYGAKFDRQFPVSPCPPGVEPAKHAHDHVQAIQAVWAKRLGHLQSNPSAIRFALDNLPEHPPTLPEFAALCNRRPQPADLAALSGPKADPDRVQQVLAELNVKRAPIDRLAPLRELHDRDVNHGGVMANGKRITLAQRATYRQALGLNKGE